MSERTMFRKAIEGWVNASTPDEVDGAGELLTAAIGNVSGDELDVVGLVLERLNVGAGIYGQWIAALDTRDLGREALDEELDDVVYRAMRSVIARQEDARRNIRGFSRVLRAIEAGPEQEPSEEPRVSGDVPLEDWSAP